MIRINLNEKNYEMYNSLLDADLERIEIKNGIVFEAGPKEKKILKELLDYSFHYDSKFLKRMLGNVRNKDLIKISMLKLSQVELDKLENK